MTKNTALFLKMLIIGGLAVVIGIALALVSSTISERQSYRDEAVKSITESYASSQRIVGPMLVQPYRQTTDEITTTDKGVKTTSHHVETSTYAIFPQALDIHGTLKPSIRRHGLYRVTVYELQATLSGHIDVPPPTIKGDVQYGVPYLAFAVKDARGIVGLPVLRVNNTQLPVLGALKSQTEEDSVVKADITKGTNLRAILPELSGKPASLDFHFDLTLAGSQSLDLVPLANSNHFDLTSTWYAPLFAGQFLPRTREVGPTGFHAAWDVSSLASATQQQVLAQDKDLDAVTTTLSDTIDPYRLSDRAVKYGILFVLLTFGGFLMFEILKQMLIHPVQYLLVGFCLAVFFLLLISFSEHMAFGAAYLLASAACIGLLTFYLVFVLRSTKYGLAFGGILTTLYAALYGLLISEDNALLLGSLLLFGVLAMVMIVTRKVDWYQRTRGASVDQPLPPSPPAYPPNL